jgi:hypothetical protein
MKRQAINNGLNNCLIKEYTTHFLCYVIEKYFINLTLNKLYNIIQKSKSK